MPPPPPSSSSSPPPATPAYLANIQALRAAAALLVLFYHLYLVEGDYFPHPTVPALLGRYGFAGVDLFFVISGFVMVLATRARFEQAGEWRRFLLGRVLRIYPLYWFFTLLVLVVLTVRPHWVDSSRGALGLLTSLTLFPNGEQPLVIQGWTLSYEMFFYLVFALAMVLVPRRALPWWLAAWAALTAAAAVWLRPHLTLPLLQLVSDPLALEFIAGCGAALVFRAVPRRAAVILLAAGLVASVLCVALAQAQSYSRVVELRALYFGIPSALLVAGAAAVEWRLALRAPRVWRYLGEASYSIYLSHLLLIATTAWLWKAVLLTHLGPAWGTLACAVVALAGGCLVYEGIEKPLTRYTRRWSRRAPQPAPVRSLG